jgi:hypothetical protein
VSDHSLREEKIIPAPGGDLKNLLTAIKSFYIPRVNIHQPPLHQALHALHFALNVFLLN